MRSLIVILTLLVFASCEKRIPPEQMAWINTTDSVKVVWIKNYPSGFWLYPHDTATFDQYSWDGYSRALGNEFSASTLSGCYLQFGIVTDFNVLTPCYK